jgi:hypothetical protein
MFGETDFMVALTIIGMLLTIIFWLTGLIEQNISRARLEMEAKKIGEKIDFGTNRVLDALKELGPRPGRRRPGNQKKWDDKLSYMICREANLESAVRRVLTHMGVKHDLAPDGVTAYAKGKPYAIKTKASTHISKKNVLQAAKLLQTGVSASALIIAVEKPPGSIKNFAKKNKVSIKTIKFPLDDEKLESILQGFLYPMRKVRQKKGQGDFVLARFISPRGK